MGLHTFSDTTSSLQKKSNMNKKTFAGGITFALVVSLSIVTSGCSSNIDEPTFDETYVKYNIH